MTLHPQFWIVAGPNGAGKTTLVQRGPISELLADVEFLNPNDVSLAMLRRTGYATWLDVPEDRLRQTFIEAANEVYARVESLLQSRQSVGVETVLSTHKYQPLVEATKRQGGGVGLIYVALSSPSISRSRIDRRVARGGHDVPTEKIEHRWRQSLANLSWYLTRASEFWVFNNSDSNAEIAPPLVAQGQGGTLTWYDESHVFPELRTVLSSLS